MKEWNVRHELYQNIAKYYEERVSAEIRQIFVNGRKVSVSAKAPKKSNLDISIYTDKGKTIIEKRAKLNGVIQKRRSSSRSRV